ncbi:MAG: LssY C-terminal domain-containing protein [Elusimicrobia bacterium]|nr:LssY C-terminal domain-containing protein [Elusimicrobiota bacterium]
MNSGRGGRPGDPWNLLFLGSEEALSSALRSGGWTRAPGSVLGSVAAGLGELARGRRLTRFPPLNAYRLFERVQDHGWVLVTRAVFERHHFRLWRAPFADADGRAVWWGSANYDRGARLCDLSHVPDPYTPAERDFIAGTLRGLAEVESVELRPAPQVPQRGTNDKGYPFFTDGRVLVVRLRA